jgi:hypothetical protein
MKIFKTYKVLADSESSIKNSLSEVHKKCKRLNKIEDGAKRSELCACAYNTQVAGSIELSKIRNNQFCIGILCAICVSLIIAYVVTLDIIYLVGAPIIYLFINILCDNAIADALRMTEKIAADSNSCTVEM